MLQLVWKLRGVNMNYKKLPLNIYSTPKKYTNKNKELNQTHHF